MIGIYTVAIASAALDALVAGWVLVGGRTRVDTQRMLASALASAAFFAVKAAVLFALLPERSLFMLVLLGYAYVAGTLPLLGLAVFHSARRRPVSAPVRAAAALSLCAAPLALWCSLVEPFRLCTEEVAVPLAPERAGRAALRIGVLADVQARAVGDFERQAVARLMALAPDLIVIPGDLAQVWPRDEDAAVEEFHALVAPLDAPLGVWMVLGNSDDETLVHRALSGTRVRLLEDERVELTWRDRRVTLCGIGKLFWSERAKRAAAELEALPGEGDVRILLTHYPDALELLPADSRVDLLVAGHTHGGQVQIPLLGPPITLSNVPRRIAAGGLHELGGRRVYVSRGLGVERGWAPRMRLDCPPEITLLTLSGASAALDIAERDLRTEPDVPQGSR